MIKETIASLVEEAAQSAQADGSIPAVALPDISVERPQRPEHGDYAVNLPLRLARTARANPLELARAIAARIEAPQTLESVEVAAPGFLNFRLKA
ncbi:MAG: arginine--tRNA ligase, partial [Dehalococcoidia bacterium]|nr:arginine--tRNA ligase [Dehalococcoidia bacterium]